jgi:RNA polymerase sigma factor (sigma-70 family)
MLDDAELVDAARAGDQGAFGTLAERWFDRCWEVAWRILHDRELAADVAQDTLVTAWQRLASLEQAASFGGWVLRIARNRALDRLTRERRTVSTGDEERLERAATGPSGIAAAGLSGPEAAVERRESSELLWAAAAALGERDASLLDLHLRHGLEPGELATELGIAPNAAHQALFRMRTRLGHAVRAWLLWRGGEPDCVVLRAELTAMATPFGREVVRLVLTHVESCLACAEESERCTAPAAMFAAVPLVIVPLSLRADALAAVQTTIARVAPDADAPGPTGTAEGAEPTGPARRADGAETVRPREVASPTGGPPTSPDAGRPHASPTAGEDGSAAPSPGGDDGSGAKTGLILPVGAMLAVLVALVVMFLAGSPSSSTGPDSLTATDAGAIAPPPAEDLGGSDVTDPPPTEAASDPSPAPPPIDGWSVWPPGPAVGDDPAIGAGDTAQDSEAPADQTEVPSDPTPTDPPPPGPDPEPTPRDPAPSEPDPDPGTREPEPPPEPERPTIVAFPAPTLLGGCDPVPGQAPQYRFRFSWETLAATAVTLDVGEGPEAVAAPVGSADRCVDLGQPVTLVASNEAGSVQRTVSAG